MEKNQGAKLRSQVALEDRWNVAALYPSWEYWERELALFTSSQKAPSEESLPEKHIPWECILSFKGKAEESATSLSDLLVHYFETERHLGKLYTYAHLRHDEDVADETAKSGFERINSIIHDFRQATAWIEPEILQIPEEKWQEFLTQPSVKPYLFYLQKIMRLKPHTLSTKEETISALAAKPLDVAYKAFGALNNADAEFPLVKDSAGKEHPLTHASYLSYLRQKDRTLRKEAFTALHHYYERHENTLCELLHGLIQSHHFQAQIRGYSSCLEAALFPKGIDLQVYHALIKTVRSHLGSLHRYMHLRKKLLGYETLHAYDLHVSLVQEGDMSMEYSQAEKLVVDSVEVLGKEYQEILRRGLQKEGWVDKYENFRKRSGAYSSGCYDSFPYILLNYQGSFTDVMTLAHETGHSMHTLLSLRQQPFHYAQYPIFLAEVASTFHEELLLRHLLAQVDDRKKRCYLLNQKIDDMRATFFRQTLFAEFELCLHEWVERGVPLTPALLKKEYIRLNEEYFGPAVFLDEELGIEWARIPHFYYDFYVYQYATGISAALSLVDLVEKEGPQKYKTFLASGGSDYPLRLLQQAGVDMRSSVPVLALIDRFDRLVAELESLMQEQDIK